MCRRAGAFCLLALLGSVPASGQAKFEVADVHSSPRSRIPVARGPFFNNGRYELRFASMLDLIRMAYDVDPEKVLGGPSWLEWDRFDVFAKAPDSSTVESRRLMLQGLLAERFRLAIHTTAPGIVVDSVNRKPTPNSEVAAKAFPPPPAEFEVATLKPSDPNAVPRAEIRNGRFLLSRITVKGLIFLGWELNGEGFLVGAPKWLDEDSYEINAKVPAEVAMGDLGGSERGALPVNLDALRPMIRALLKERFKMAVHMEDRPLGALTLQTAKPKLKKADPNSRTRCQSIVLPEKAENPLFGRRLTCQNVTMARFAEVLSDDVPGYAATSVADATGLEGGWDFTLTFSTAFALMVRDAKSAGGGVAEGPDFPRVISLFDAVRNQLGLKLETQKRPMPVLVIDRIERKPIDN